MDGQAQAPAMEATFHSLVGELDYAMFIVTAAVGEDRAGCLVGFATQTSIDPARFLVCLSQRNRTFAVASRAEVLAVHFVPEDAVALAELFGSQSGHDVDKFSRCSWRPGFGGAPILDDCPNWFAGEVLERRAAGDHTAFLLAPVAAEHATSADELPFRRAKRIEAGRES